MKVRRLAHQAGVAVRDWWHAGRTQTRAHLARLRRRAAPSKVVDSPCATIPVVLLPGILEPVTYLAPLGDFLGGLGHPVVGVNTLGWNLSTVARSTERALAAMADHAGDTPVLVAHSKGGLIGKSVLLHEQGRDTVAGMVAIATPFSGSDLGGPLRRLGIVARSPLGLFGPGNAELAELARQRDVNARIVSLAPSFDQMIPNGSHLDGATNVTLDVAGHFAPVNDPGVWDLVHEHVHALADANTSRDQG